jgi:hypothetical protein
MQVDISNDVYQIAKELTLGSRYNHPRYKERAMISLSIIPRAP